MVDFCALPANVPAGIPTMISTNGPRFSLIGMSLFGFSSGFLPEIPGKNSGEFAQNGSEFVRNGSEFGKFGAEFDENGAGKTKLNLKSGKGAACVSHTAYSTLSSIRNQGREAAFPKSILLSKHADAHAGFGS